MDGDQIEPPVPTVALDPASLVFNATGAMAILVWLLIVIATLVWVLIVLKSLQIRRWTRAERLFEDELDRHGQRPGAWLNAWVDRSFGARLLSRMTAQAETDPELIEATADRTLLDIEERTTSLMTALSSIGAVSPLLGLFGTVYGIMDAFLRIGREKSATLPVVGPAIGEALLTTAIGLFAAIPAVVAFNALNQKLTALVDRIGSNARHWSKHLARGVGNSRQ